VFRTIDHGAAMLSFVFRFLDVTVVTLIFTAFVGG
jgi:hypothetical protein